MLEKPRFAALALAGLLGLLPALPGCGGPDPAPEETQAQTGAQAADAEWNWLTTSKQALDEKRERLAQLEALPAAGADSALQPAPNPGEDSASLRKEVDALTDELNRRLVDFINADPPVVGQPLTPRQKAAIAMKSDEDIVLAREFIDEGGDYRRAIEIYEAALQVDKENPRLKSELARARARRYMTRERFAQVESGMSQDQVRGLLGAPNVHNVREYPDRRIVAWFYPKDASGASAGVFFQKADSGAWQAYKTDFDAIQPSAPPAPPGQRRPPAAPAQTPAPAAPRT